MASALQNLEKASLLEMLSSPYSRPKLIYEFLAQIDFFSFASCMVLYEEEIKACKAIKQQIINKGNQAHYMTERYSQFF